MERIVSPQKAGNRILRTISAGIPYSLLSRIDGIGFPAFGLVP